MTNSPTSISPGAMKRGKFGGDKIPRSPMGNVKRSPIQQSKPFLSIEDFDNQPIRGTLFFVDQKSFF